MAQSSDPKDKNKPKIKSEQAPSVADSQGEAYELDETPKAAAPATPPAVNRSYLIDAAPTPAAKDERLERARKMLGGADDEKPVAPIDPAAAALKREEARRRSAEMWAQEEAHRGKMLLIKLAVFAVAILAVVCYFIWF